MCVNFQPLNKTTLKQKFPMPKIDRCLARLHGSAVYSTFDFTGAFLQIRIHPDYMQKTAPHTCTRKLEYTCIPFGFVMAPAELKCQINQDFSGRIIQGWVIIYMDVVLI